MLTQTCTCCPAVAGTPAVFLQQDLVTGTAGGAASTTPAHAHHGAGEGTVGAVRQPATQAATAAGLQAAAVNRQAGSSSYSCMCFPIVMRMTGLDNINHTAGLCLL
jgi:hypothetical protein